MEENNNNKTEKQQTVASYVHDDDDDADDLDLCLGLRHPQHGNNIKMKRKDVVQNDVVIEGGERRRKVVNWWGNVEMVRVSQGYNRHFTPAAAATATAENSRSPVSTGSSYSGVSDSYHSNSYAGGHSSDTSSHSSHSRLHLSSAKQPDSSNEDTNQNSPNHNHNNNRNSNHNQFSTNVTSTDTKDKEPSSSGPRSPSPKDTKVVLGKPPKPKRQTSQQSVLLPQMQMPCVSATGNGPNGKTITGFLYKYSKTEVSIVCVCHGTSFSPAGFVEHAGGVDVEHPLRHIRVAPFPLS